MKKEIECQSDQVHQIKWDSSSPSLKDKQKQSSQKQICRPYLNGMQKATVNFIATLYCLHLLPIVVSYVLLSNSNDPTTIELKTNIRNAQFLEVPILWCILILKLIVIMALYLDYKFCHEKELHKLLIRLAEYLREHLRIMVQIDLLSSAFFLIAKTPLSLINFILSAAIIAFSLVFLQNYSTKKDNFFIGSILFHVIMRIKIAVGSIIGFFCLIFGESSISMELFLGVHAILAIITVAAYFSEGFIIYRNTTLRWGIFISVSAYQSLSITMVMGVVSHLDFFTFAVYFLLVTFAVSYYLYHYMEKRKQQVVNQSTSLLLQVFCFLQILEQSSQNEENQVFLIGLLNMHSFAQCKNPHCYVNSSTLYDGKAKAYFSLSDLHKGNASQVFFYMKCRFESFLINNPTDFNVMLNYAEFIYHQLNNVALCLLYLKKIQLNMINLNWTNKLKLNRLARRIYQDNTLFCQQAYGSKVEIEELIRSQQTNKEISAMTLQLLQQRIQIWQLLENGQIDISQLRKKTENIMNKLQRISSKWKSLSNYVQRSNNWKYQYICFALFLKNERLKTKVMEDFNNDRQSQIAKNISTDIGVKSIAASLFDPSSCCIHTYLKQGNVFVKKVSKYLTNVTGYTSEEMENANISILMPRSVVQKHTQMLAKMSQQGFFSNQSTYMIKQVYIINKKGFIVPVVKLYKEYVTEQGQLEYVCFFKKINEHQNLLLCNDNFDILGITEKCSEIISEEENNGQYIKSLNLISLMPGLAKLTKFNQFVSQKEELYPIVSIQPRKRKQASLTNHPISSNHNSVSLSINQTEQLTLVYPSQSLQKFSLYYKTLIDKIVCQSLEDMYQCIVKVTNDILKQSNHVFDCSVSLKHLQSKYGMEYFEVKLSKMRLNQPKKFIEVKPEIIEQSSSFNQEASQQFFIEETPKELNVSSISAKTNIYLKQQINEAPRTNVCLKYLKYIWIALFFQLALIVTVNMLLFKQQFDNMAVSINNIYQSGQVSITSSRLVNLYIAKLLNITTISSIQETTHKLQGFINNPLMHKAIFDKTINPPLSYYASSDFAQNSSGYNEIDFLYFIESIFQTLSSPQQIAINSSLYNLIMDYQYPSLNDYLNQTNINLSIEFNTFESILKTESAIIFTLELALIITSAILVLALSFKFYESMLEMVKIHCRFSKNDIQKNIRHIRKLINILQDLQNLDAKNSTFSITSKTVHTQKNTFLNNKILQSSNLNKKSKKIVIGKALKRQKLLYNLKVIGCFTVLTIMCALRNIYYIQLKNPVQNQEIIGQNFFNFIPTHYLTAQIMASAYLPDAVPAYYPDQYLPLLSNLYIQMNLPYISTPQPDAFSQLTKQFYFADACAISVQSLTANNITLKECYSTANHSLSGGLQRYSRYQYEMVRSFFNSSKSLSFQQLSQYFRSIDIYHTINNFMVQTWADYYVTLTSQILTKIDRVTFLSLCVLFLMISLFKILIFKYTKKEYEFYHFFYANMMPEEIVSGEKIIRSQLSEINFL